MKDHPFIGVVLIIIALALAAVAGAFMKGLGAELSPFVISWFRFFGIVVLLLPIALIWKRSETLRPKSLRIHGLRGLCLAFSTVCFVIGAQTLDYADAIAILYAYPFLVVAAAPFYLGEKVSAVGWIGIVGGFLGVVLVVRPDFQNINSGALWILLCATLVGIQMLLNRRLGGVTDPLVTSLWGGIVAAGVHTIALPFSWNGVTAEHFWLLCLLAAVGAASQTLTVYAFTWARAADLAPFTYTEIIVAVVIGFIAFGSLPTSLSWAGIALIMASGLLVAHAMRNRVRTVAAAKTP